MKVSLPSSLFQVDIFSVLNRNTWDNILDEKEREELMVSKLFVIIITIIMMIAVNYYGQLRLFN